MMDLHLVPEHSRLLVLLCFLNTRVNNESDESSDHLYPMMSPFFRSLLRPTTDNMTVKFLVKLSS